MNNPTYLLQGLWAEASPDGTKIGFSRFDPASLGPDGTGTFKAYVADRNGANEVCISAFIPTTHCGMIHWHPSGEWIVLTREMAPGYEGVHFNAHSGKGIFVNLWAVRPDGTEWTQLTSYASSRDGSPMHSAIGCLQARFNHAGNKMVWSRKIGTDPVAPFSFWEIAVADWSTPGGIPTLSNHAYYKPDAGNFYEIWDWNNADTTLIIASDAGVGATVYIDNFFWVLGAASLTNISGPNIQWDEQCFYSPDETRVAFGTSRQCHWPYNPVQDMWGTWFNDVFSANAQGGLVNRQRETYFCVPGHPQEFQRPAGIVVRAIPSHWADDGRMLIQLVTNDAAGDQDHAGSEMWEMQFDGKYHPPMTTVVLEPSADALIIDITPTTNYETLALVAVGDSSPTLSSAYRSLLKFNLSGIPANATILSAFFGLHEYSAADTAATGVWNVLLARVLQDWVSSQVTWNVWKTGSNWTTAGAKGAADIAAVWSEAQLLDGTAANGWISWGDAGLTSDVQRMVSGEIPNYGWMLYAPDAENLGTTPVSTNLFRSANYASQKPTLTIGYTLPAAMLPLSRSGLVNGGLMNGGLVCT